MTRPLLRAGVLGWLCAAWLPGCRGPSTSHHELGWAPGDCTARYQVRVGDDEPRILELGFPRDEAGRVPRDRWGRWVGRATLYGSSATEEDREGGVERRVTMTRTGLWPAAPDAACRARPVDLVESALALGWPQLPATGSDATETWTGPAPDGLCDELACFDPDGTPTERPCVAPAWTFRRVARVPHAARRPAVAVVEGRWSDGGAGARAQTVSRIDVEAGRLSSTRATVWPPFAGRADGGRRGPLVLELTFVECAPR